MTDSEKTVNDVAPAGQTAPEPSARPIIITNRPIVKDPMMTDNGEVAPNVMLKRQPDEVKPAPASETPASEPPEAEPSKVGRPPTPELPEAEPAKEATEPAAEQQSAAASPTETKPAAEEQPIAASPETESAGTEQLEDEEAEASKQAEHDAAIQKLVDQKRYFLPINAVERRRSRRFVLLGVLLSLVLAVAWVDVALDAGLIHLGGVKSVTHFFSN